MKAPLVLATLFLPFFASGTARAATEAFKAQFGDFVGRYEIVSCSGRLLKGADRKETADDLCDRKYVHIFLGDDYQEKADGNIYFFNRSDSLAEPRSADEARASRWVGTDLAHDPATADKGEQIISAYGTELDIGTTQTGPSLIDQSTISRQKDLVVLHHLVSWPQAGAGFLYNETTLVLKKLD